MFLFLFLFEEEEEKENTRRHFEFLSTLTFPYVSTKFSLALFPGGKTAQKWRKRHKWCGLLEIQMASGYIKMNHQIWQLLPHCYSKISLDRFSTKVQGKKKTYIACICSHRVHMIIYEKKLDRWGVWDQLVISL